ncbi:TetR/AcrR family transcriptional regulator, partial [Paracraurococcus ruber]
MRRDIEATQAEGPAHAASRAGIQRSRRRILAGAARLLRQDGIAGTNLAAVMRAAGMTHAGFSHHFPDKDALVAAALDQAFGDMLDRLAAEAVRLAAAGAWYLLPGHRLPRRRHGDRGGTRPGGAAGALRGRPGPGGRASGGGAARPARGPAAKGLARLRHAGRRRDRRPRQRSRDGRRAARGHAHRRGGCRARRPGPHPAPGGPPP